MKVNLKIKENKLITTSEQLCYNKYYFYHYGDRNCLIRKYRQNIFKDEYDFYMMFLENEISPWVVPKNMFLHGLCEHTDFTLKCKILVAETINSYLPSKFFLDQDMKLYYILNNNMKEYYKDKLQICNVNSQHIFIPFSNAMYHNDIIVTDYMISKWKEIPEQLVEMNFEENK